MTSEKPTPDTQGKEELLRIEDLKLYFFTLLGIVKALDGVELHLEKGDTLGLVGETGCGKSVTALSTIRLVPMPPAKIIDGKIFFEGNDLVKVDEEKIRSIRGHKISVVFQEPTTSLNPVLKVGNQVGEVIMIHQDLAAEALECKIDRFKSRKTWLEDKGLAEVSRLFGLQNRIDELRAIADAKGTERLPKPSRKDLRRAALRRAVELLRLTGLPDPEKTAERYPHELSGGMRQRVMIAIALACNPDLLIADEPTSSLDVTIQAQIIQLMRELKKQMRSSILLITHHLGLVAHMCNKVAVMYAGRVVEYADTKDLFRTPLHPYTRALLRSVPKLREKVERLDSIPGTVPDLLSPPSGCRFHPRCESALGLCQEQTPKLIEVCPQHFVSCHLTRG
jgi:oligopeptide/dipeptide ABC transporter ATP-binding protein